MKINQLNFAWVAGIIFLALTIRNAFIQNAWELRVLEIENELVVLREKYEAVGSQVGTPSFISNAKNMVRVASARVHALRAAHPNPKGLKPVAPATEAQAKDIVAERRKHRYGGDENDPQHIGGWLANDTQSWEPKLWNWLIHTQKIKSLVDVGCGSGLVTNYFHERGVDVTCLEGSSEGIQRSHLPADRIVHHDFSRGPWYPKKVVDLAYSVEFLEHLADEHMDNVMALFKSARYVIIAASKNGGHHHVNVHFRWWWIERMEAYGFEYARTLTEEVLKNLIDKTKSRTYSYLGITGLVFRNPEVDFEKAFKEPGVMLHDRKKLWAEWKDDHLQQCKCF